MFGVAGGGVVRHRAAWVRARTGLLPRMVRKEAGSCGGAVGSRSRSRLCDRQLTACSHRRFGWIRTVRRVMVVRIRTGTDPRRVGTRTVRLVVRRLVVIAFLPAWVLAAITPSRRRFSTLCSCGRLAALLMRLSPLWDWFFLKPPCGPPVAQEHAVCVLSRTCRGS